MYTREGCRGGREQFKWDSLKEQDFKDREQYLGASTKVGMMAKFGKYYVHDWYAKKRDTAESIEDERQIVQQYEEELMQEALGLKPKKLLLARKQLSEEELKEFLRPDLEKRADQLGREQMGPQRKGMVDSDGVERDAQVIFADSRISGLGFAAHRTAKLEKYKSDVLGTESKLEGIKGEPIKLEVKSEIKNEPMTDTECLRLGEPASSSSAAGWKKEEENKDAVQKVEKVEAEIKEIKDEPDAPDMRAQKRHREDGNDEDKGQAKEKKEKKAKKAKKSEKKLKKKVKKAAKKQKKAAKLAAKLVGSRSSRKPDSRSSDSSSSSS